MQRVQIVYFISRCESHCRDALRYRRVLWRLLKVYKMKDDTAPENVTDRWRNETIWHGIRHSTCMTRTDDWRYHFYTYYRYFIILWQLPIKCCTILDHPHLITSPHSLSPSITPSAFHSRRKTHLFHKSFPPWSSWFLLDCLHGSWTCTVLSGRHWRVFVLVYSFYFLFLATCARLSWPHSPS